MPLPKLARFGSVSQDGNYPKNVMPVTAVHPREHLAEELNGLGISAAEVTRRLNVPTNRITEVLNARRAITDDTALRNFG